MPDYGRDTNTGRGGEGGENERLEEEHIQLLILSELQGD